MQIERQDRRAIADQDLGVQTIAVPNALNRLNVETRKILAARQIPHRLAYCMRAAV
jgi:hypothetical protein